MFTGLVEDVGTVVDVRSTGMGKRIRVRTGLEVEPGDSVAVDGVCLTVEGLTPDGFWTYLSRETLGVTKFRAGIRVSARVNLERALAVGERLGGHFVLGHVDSTGKLLSIKRDAESVIWQIRLLEPEFSKYMVYKGSIAVDGVSLTINSVSGSMFSIRLIPFTLSHTNFGDRRPGDILNLEFDVLAKYVEKLLSNRGE